MLLVYHDKTEVRKRREYCRPRADGDARLARQQPSPFVEPLAVRQSRMQQRDRIAEPRAEYAHDLRRKRYFGHEHDGGLADCERFFDAVEINLGLAAAGHAE